MRLAVKELCKERAKEVFGKYCSDWMDEQYN